MGSYGITNKPTNNSTNFVGFEDVNDSREHMQDISNEEDWWSSLSQAEQSIVRAYTDTAYRTLNPMLYETPWEELTTMQKRRVADLYNALSKFELEDGLRVTRRCDFQIFGAKKGDMMTLDEVKNFLAPSKGVVQNDAFLSFSADKHGRAVAGSGLVLHLNIPPSKGAGAFVDPHSEHKGENEFLVNNNSVIRWDYKNAWVGDDSKIHVQGDWLGQAQSQTISETNKSKLRKKKA